MADLEVRLLASLLDTVPRTLRRQPRDGSKTAGPDRRDHARHPVRGWNVLNRFLTWRKVRRIRLYRQWLGQSRVILPEPDQRCRRNSVEAVP
jgi:hypothetical protein